MKREEIQLGDTVRAKVKEDMAHVFTGTVQKKYENSALLAITDYDPSDKQNAAELNFKIVINFKAVTKNLGGGHPDPEPEPEPDHQTNRTVKK
ncbi:DUF2187 domain-containing protein [Lacticaseibacillus camelliae]|uniref:DUF2187 domain-containing protein n=1 Tax=Lacticaseibacillus camelliae DSM 22697 = JCM 13995 TaxID=1423730 RepID=A0A0R2FBS6_9LACO|nr:DUF2187 domain-containing protein [Lacticaseibacillus camelliae]KRN25872.1 hypothetical protein FC75_GL002005 [Lacticaseibacillus camelliae DSM 22697 = JCM 13995]